MGLDLTSNRELQILSVIGRFGAESWRAVLLLTKRTCRPRMCYHETLKEPEFNCSKSMPRRSCRRTQLLWLRQFLFWDCCFLCCCRFPAKSEWTTIQNPNLFHRYNSFRVTFHRDVAWWFFVEVTIRVEKKEKSRPILYRNIFWSRSSATSATSRIVVVVVLLMQQFSSNNNVIDR